MNKSKIYFITTNEFKFQSFSTAIDLDDYRFIQKALETPEIQADNNHLVAEYSAKWAAEKLQSPVITEDVGMYIHALNGFPGPFLSQVEKQIGAEGFLVLMHGKHDRTAFWEYSVAYCEPGSEPISFFTIQKGTIADVQKGIVGWPMGKIFIQDGQSKTIAELLETDSYVRDNDHYAQLRAYLGER